jgi:dihydroflavonol-4-reductase
VVFGATGFIGRWLVKELLDAGVSLTGVVRSEASGQMLRAWLTDHPRWSSRAATDAR